MTWRAPGQEAACRWPLLRPLLFSGAQQSLASAPSLEFHRQGRQAAGVKGYIELSPCYIERVRRQPPAPDRAKPKHIMAHKDSRNS